MNLVQWLRSHGLWGRGTAIYKYVLFKDNGQHNGIQFE